MFTSKIGIKSQVSKHVSSAKSTSRMPRDVPKKPMAPAGGEGLRSHFAVCVWRWSAGFAVCFVGPTTALSCSLLFLFFFPSVSGECEHQFHAASRTFPSPSWHRSRKSRRRRCVSFAHILAAI